MTAAATIPTLARGLARRVGHWRPAAHPPAEESGEVIDLARSYPAGPPPAWIAEAAGEALDRGETHYVDSTGLPALREAIAADYGKARGWQVAPEQILVTNGAQEALFLILRGLFEPGDEILVPDLGGALVQNIAVLAGASLVHVPTAEGGFRLTAGALEAHVTSRTRAVLILSPSHVSGSVIWREEAARIAGFARRHNLCLIVDEALVKGAYAGVEIPCFGLLPEIGARLFTVGGLSKFYRLGGWRIGWIAAESGLLQPLRELKQAMSICTAALCQRAAIAALTGPQAWLAEQQAEFAARRDQATQALDAIGLPYVPPEAAFYLLADIRSSGLSSGAFADLALRQARLRVASGAAFGPGGEGYVRLSLAEPADRLEAAWSRLAGVWRGQAA
jgi:aspartate/methionine/tyrosine aminotransferase